MKPRLILVSLALLSSTAALSAEDAAPAKSDNAPAVPPYELKKRSTFNCASEEARAPFWPIGWVKQKQAATGAMQQVATPKVALDEKAFKVTSILLGSGSTPSLAVINGRAYSEGEFLRMPKGANPVRIRVQQIADGGVVLQHAQQMFVASLNRPELVARKAEELLLDEDR